MYLVRFLPIRGLLMAGAVFYNLPSIAPHEGSPGSTGRAFLLCRQVVAQGASKVKALINRFLAHPRWVMAVAVLIPGILWADILIFQLRRFGQPYEGFIHDPWGKVSYLSKYSGTGWEAGLRGLDVVVAVNGQPWSQLQSVLRRVGVGGTVVYTVLRGGQTLNIPVPLGPFGLASIAQITLPAGLMALVTMVVGLLVYRHNPGGYLNRLMLLYS
jgi:hypothetical protein